MTMANENATQTTTVRNKRKTKTGIVVAAKMNKTVTVTIERRFPHPLYRKYFKKSTKYLVHDEHSSAGVGDLVATIKPNVFASVPRIYEKVYDKVMDKVNNAPPIRRTSMVTAWFATPRTCATLCWISLGCCVEE